MRISSAAMLLLRDGHIQDSNPKLDELYGCSRQTLQGLPFDLLFTSAIDTRVKPGAPFHRVAIRADQTIFEAEVTLLPLEEQQCLALLDLDHFKRIDDQFGHDVGDEVLIAFAGLCQEHARSHDIFARWGGEEFAFLLSRCEMADARLFLEHLAGKLATMRIRGLPDKSRITFSAGLANYPHTETLDSVLKQADSALYRAKANGRARLEQ